MIREVIEIQIYGVLVGQGEDGKEYKDLRQIPSFYIDKNTNLNAFRDYLRKKGIYSVGEKKLKSKIVGGHDIVDAKVTVAGRNVRTGKRLYVHHKWEQYVDKKISRLESKPRENIIKPHRGRGEVKSNKKTSQHYEDEYERMSRAYIEKGD